MSKKSFSIARLIAGFFISLIWAQVSLAQQGTGKAFVSLNPAGDFVAVMKTTGSASLTGNKVSAKSITIDLKSLSTGLDLRDDHAKNKYIEVSKYPTAEIVNATGENGNGQATLKFHGKEAPVKGTYKVNGKQLDVEFKMKLSDFGITEISYKGIGVEDEVRIQALVPIAAAEAPATKPAPAPPAATQPKKK